MFERLAFIAYSEKHLHTETAGAKKRSFCATPTDDDFNKGLNSLPVSGLLCRHTLSLFVVFMMTLAL